MPIALLMDGLAAVAAVTPAQAVVVAGVLARMLAAVWAGALPLAAVGCGRIKAAVAVALTVAAAPAAVAAVVASAAGAPQAVDWPAVVGIVLGEAVVGLAIGLAAAAVFAAASWAGQILGGVTGLTWSDDVGGGDGDDAAGIGRLAWWLGLAGFVAAGGQESLIAGLVDGVRLLPVAAVASDPARESLAAVVAAMPTVGLTLAISLAAPAVAAVLAFHVGAAIAVRSVGFVPAQGLVQAAAAVVLLAALCGGTDSWIGGFAAAVQPPLERCLHDIQP
ncbi:MAG: flagellar biosynthetic protein FliR [Planctomycetaceae bacterium]